MAENEPVEDHSFRTGKYRFRPPFMTPAHPDEVAFSWLSYDISRYFFEFMRNFLVVGALLSRVLRICAERVTCCICTQQWRYMVCCLVRE
jgi:hypothetical protein